MDQPFQARVELPSDTASEAVRLTLPAGLYSVEAAVDASADAERVIPLLSSPELLVVASGRVTTIHVHHVDVSDLAASSLAASSLAALDAELAPR